MKYYSQQVLELHLSAFNVRYNKEFTKKEFFKYIARKDGVRGVSGSYVWEAIRKQRNYIDYQIDEAFKYLKQELGLN
jgi:hypothetical protein